MTNPHCVSCLRPRSVYYLLDRGKPELCHSCWRDGLAPRSPAELAARTLEILGEPSDNRAWQNGAEFIPTPSPYGYSPEYKQGS